MIIQTKNHGTLHAGRIAHIVTGGMELGEHHTALCGYITPERLTQESIGKPESQKPPICYDCTMRYIRENPV